jgi:rRNA maturation endonuclease Nob1
MARKRKEPRKVKPEYVCCSCSHRWATDGPYKDKCPQCGHRYYEWINYVEWCTTHDRSSPAPRG